MRIKRWHGKWAHCSISNVVIGFCFQFSSHHTHFLAHLQPWKRHIEIGEKKSNHSRLLLLYCYTKNRFMRTFYVVSTCFAGGYSCFGKKVFHTVFGAICFRAKLARRKCCVLTRIWVFPEPSQTGIYRVAIENKEVCD